MAAARDCAAALGAGSLTRWQRAPSRPVRGQSASLVSPGQPRGRNWYHRIASPARWCAPRTLAHARPGTVGARCHTRRVADEPGVFGPSRPGDRTGDAPPAAAPAGTHRSLGPRPRDSPRRRLPDRRRHAGRHRRPERTRRERRRAKRCRAKRCRAKRCRSERGRSAGSSRLDAAGAGGPGQRRDRRAAPLVVTGRVGGAAGLPGAASRSATGTRGVHRGPATPGRGDLGAATEPSPGTRPASPGHRDPDDPVPIPGTPDRRPRRTRRLAGPDRRGAGLVRRPQGTQPAGTRRPAAPLPVPLVGRSADRGTQTPAQSTAPATPH